MAPIGTVDDFRRGGDDATRKKGRATTDDRGKFNVRIFSGIRLHRARMYFDKAGYVFRPGMGGAHDRYSSDDYFGFFGLFRSDPGPAPSDPTIRGWPVASDLVYVEKLVIDNLELPFSQVVRLDDRSMQLQISGSKERLEVGIRLPGNAIQRVEHTPEEFELLVAPIDGYQDAASFDAHCDIRPKFFIVDSEKRYGWFRLNLGNICAKEPRLWISYRLSNTPKIRALACTDEKFGESFSRDCTE